MTPAPVQSLARCGHFGSCGGCSLQDLGPEQQLLRKRERVERALAGAALGAFHSSPELWFYRNKMEFSFGDVYPPRAEGPSLYLGLKPKGRWYQILDLRECYLLSQETAALLESVRRWAEKERLLPYNSRRHGGFLRHLVLREGKNTGERMVNLVTSEGALPAASFLEAVSAAYPATTVVRGLNAKVSDTAVADAFERLLGPGVITETLRLEGKKLRFRISPNSFFQTNTRGAEVLYGVVRRWIAELRPELLLDLYCGGGGISLSLADLCGRVVGVETNPHAVADARVNADLNAVPNTQFYAGPAETLLPSLLDMRPVVVVADPPRSGLHAKAATALLDSGPPVLIYVSCNPESLGRDLAVLSARYRVCGAEAVDLFPQTEHVETAMLLRRLD